MRGLWAGGFHTELMKQALLQYATVVVDSRDSEDTTSHVLQDRISHCLTIISVIKNNASLLLFKNSCSASH